MGIIETTGLRNAVSLSKWPLGIVGGSLLIFGDKYAGFGLPLFILAAMITGFEAASTTPSSPPRYSR
jgi:hypothetical protein